MDRTGSGTASGPDEAERRARRQASGDDAAYLARLGERVRALRTRRGMTRRILARQSGVSERYLAQLEGGEGNISVILLRQIARAIGVPVGDLASEEPEPPVELALLLQFAQRLTPAQLTEARALLTRTFAVEAQERHGRIALIGLRGAGKTTLGRLLADRLGVPFIELTREIEREAGMDLAEIMGLGGQPMYRRLERRLLERVIAGNDRAVIATGGGLVAETANLDLLLSSCRTVWVAASPEEHMARVIAQGDRRPMADNPEAMADLRRILAEREALYAKADHRLDTSARSVAESLDELWRLAAAEN